MQKVERLDETWANVATLLDLIRERTSANPDLPAFEYLPNGEGDSVSLSFAEIERQARAIASVLLAKGAYRERVMLLYPPGLEYVPALFGCIYAGTVAVAAFPPAPTGSLARFEALIGDADPALILTTARLLPMLESRFAESQLLSRLECLPSDVLALGDAGAYREPSVGPDDLALLMYTSGSTGVPKGVMLTHANLLWSLDFVARVAGMGPDTRYISWAPLNHSMGTIGGVLQGLAAGCRTICMPPQAFLERPARWLELITRYRGTLSGGPNFAYDLCARRVTEEEKSRLDLSSWLCSFDGSEPVRKETIDRFSAAFASCGFHSRAFFAGYGLTETANIVAGGPRQTVPKVITIEREALERNRAVRVAPSAPGGKTFVGHRLYEDSPIVVVNPETTSPSAPGEVGEIWVGGPVVALGYWRRPEETEKAFGGRLADGRGPFLRTGDLGFIDDDYLYITGRIKDLIIIRGANHYPQDIEQTSGECHPGLRAGLGAAFSVDAGGEERLVVVREFDPERGEAAEAIAAIRGAVAAAHELKPYAVVLIKAGTLPRTPSGKVQRRASRSQFLARGYEVIAEWREGAGEVVAEAAPGAPASATGGGPASAAAPTAASAAAPTAPTGVSVGPAPADVEIWLLGELARRLKVAPRDLDFKEPIARYGLDSLLASEIVARVREAFAVELPIRRLFEGATMASLAEDIVALARDRRGPVAPPIGRTPRGADHALSFAQQRMWFLAQLEPDSAYYNIPGILRLKGRLDVGALERSLGEIVRRHEALRSVFVSVEGEPRQVIKPPDEVRLEPIDLTGGAAGGGAAGGGAAGGGEAIADEAARLITEEVRRPFDLRSGPLLRAKLYRLGQDEHILVLTMHHIASDGWSHGVLMRELVTLYEAFTEGRQSPLAELPIQYVDFADWQRRWLAGDALSGQVGYWKERLAGLDPLLELPADRPRPAVQSYRGSFEIFEWQADMMARLVGLARSENATLFMTVLAGLMALLSRYTGRTDIAVGSPVANRTRPETEGLIGFFVNTLVLRADLGGNPSFREILGRVREATLGALAHQDLPFEKLVEVLQPERNLSFSPLFQVAFAFDNAPLETVKVGGLTITPEWGNTGTTQFDITLRLSGDERGTRGILEYSTDLFDRERIVRLLGHLGNLLAAAAIDPDAKLESLPLLGRDERDTVLRRWNDTATPRAEGGSIPGLFEAQVKSTPEAPAVIFRDQVLTYDQLNRRANRLAHGLRRLGVGPDSVVGVAMERSLEMVVALYGILKAGGAYLPLDPAYPRGRLEYLIKDARPAVVLTQAKFKAKIPEQARLRVASLDDEFDAVAAEAEDNPVSGVLPENLAYVIYTSGSTGEPKGVAVPHQGIVNRLLWMQEAYGLVSGDRVMQKTPYTFDVSVWEFFWPLMTGACMVVARPGGHQDPAYIRDLIAAEKITTLHFVPSMLQVFLEEPGLEGLTCLRRVFSSGEALPRSMQERFFQRLGAELHNLYGPTEASVDVTFWACRREDDVRDVPIGRPVANTRIYLLDRNLEPVPVGVPGELYIGGVCLARGYVGRPGLTAERFVPDPHGGHPGGRLYRTGDLARFRADGAIEYLGRLDFQVKVRGFRVEPGEIEATLALHPGVERAVVVAREDESGASRLLAYVVPSAKKAPKPETLRAFLKDRLPEYMVPSLFVLLDELPLTPTGKIDRRSLPVPDAPAPPRDYVAPRNSMEEVIAGIFGAVLRTDKVSVTESFFDLGGHSLLATGVIAKIRDALKVELPLRSLFESPSVAELAGVVIRRLEEQGGGELGQVLDDLEGLSDEEVKAMLSGGKKD